MSRRLVLRVPVLLAVLGAALIVPSAAAAADCPLPAQVEPDFTTALDVEGDVAAGRAGGFLQIPFHVPTGTTAIRVRYSYDQPGTPASPGGVCGGPSTNTLDMGVYSPRDRGENVFGADESEGWSGSAVKDLAIAVNGFSDESVYNSSRKALVHGRTTRAYHPGPIPDGTWAVELGLAFIAPDSADDADGIHYHVKVETTDSPDWSNEPYAPSGYSDAPVRTTPGWYAGDVHVHGEEEPGNATMTQTFARAFDPISAGGSGLDFVTLVDHNNNVAHDNLKTHQDDYPSNLIIPGTEMTTYRGHYNNEGRAPFVDFRNGPIYKTTGNGPYPDSSIQQVRGAVPPSQTFAQIQSEGNWTQINHPSIFRDLPSFCRGCAWSYSDAETDFSKVDAIEVQTGPAGIPSHGGPVSAFNPFTPEAIAYYEHALDSGAHIAAVGSSDDHKAGTATGPTDSPVGSATTVVHAQQLSEQGITDGVKADHTYVKLFGNDGPDIGLSADVPDGGSAIIGDSISGPSAALTATINGTTRSGRTGSWSLVLLKDGAPVQTVPFAGDSFTQTFDDLGTGRYSIEVVRTSGAVDYIEDYSSPIWFTKDVSNEFRFGKLRHNKRKGTAKLAVVVPGPGELTLRGKSLKRTHRKARHAGSVRLKIKPRGKLKRRLAHRGKAKVRVKVTYTPTGGEPNTRSRKVHLRERRHHRRHGHRHHRAG